MPFIDYIRELPTWIKMATAMVALVTAVGGGAVAYEDRLDGKYVTEQEVAMSLDMVQQQSQQQMQLNDMQIKMLRYEFLVSQLYEKKRQFEKDQSNQLLRDELNRLEEKRNTLGRELGLQ